MSHRPSIGWSDRGSSRNRGQRGRGSGRGGLPRRMRPQPTLDTISNPLGSLITTLTNDYLDLAATNGPSAVFITECRYVTSYNWMNTKAATITVPGKPPKWTPLEGPQQLDQDKGDYYRDPNAARFPSHPTEPAVQAVLKTNPDFPTSDINIFACGSTIGNLLRFARKMEKPFRFNVELIGNTVFFIRKENSPTELIPGVRGYGHTFPEAYTTWEREVKGSETHQRIIQYDLAGFKCLVRFECDGYFAPSIPLGTNPEAISNDSSDPTTLLDALESTSINLTPSGARDTLKVESGGAEVPQDTILDLKTRSKRSGYEIDMSDILPRLWVTQIPNFVVAYHNGSGLFTEVQEKDMGVSIREWEHENRQALKRLAVLIRRIVDFAKDAEDGKVEVFCPSIDGLEIRKQHGDGMNALSSLLKARWAGVSKIECVEREANDTSCEPVVTFIDDDDEDFTACSEACGYCGRCTH